MDHVFRCNLKKYRFRRPGCGNCRAVETVENEPQFSTVPTALGKLGKRQPSFPQFPQPLRLDRLIKIKTKTKLANALKNPMDKLLTKA